MFNIKLNINTFPLLQLLFEWNLRLTMPLSTEQSGKPKHIKSDDQMQVWYEGDGKRDGCPGAIKTL